MILLVDVDAEAMVVDDSQRNDSQPEAGAVGAAAVVNALGVDSFPQTQPQPMTMSPSGGGGDGGDNPSDNNDDFIEPPEWYPNEDQLWMFFAEYINMSALQGRVPKMRAVKEEWQNMMMTDTLPKRQLRRLDQSGDLLTGIHVPVGLFGEQ